MTLTASGSGFGVPRRKGWNSSSDSSHTMYSAARASASIPLQGLPGIGRREPASGPQGLAGPLAHERRDGFEFVLGGQRGKFGIGFRASAYGIDGLAVVLAAVPRGAAVDEAGTRTETLEPATGLMLWVAADQ
ncbi:hypothetical protein [Streptomyces sp. HF10]|uniref:hypothetical protein n=1 Tax=Streptomyces sp. HF10 TaxID=2692233 RepID=UPI0013163944|nr:hypothetical protein [Streptomyces sp. HF10]QHC33863.1 hypothetical protein GR129_34725 [Streptomyces sp. HF10]